MKMISSTSITSTRGVTLMSAMGPLLPPVLNAMAYCPFTLVATKPTSSMPCSCATFVISLMTRILVVRSPRRLRGGCGVCWAAVAKRDSRVCLSISSSFQ
ncbi:hypothetical protein D3C71_1998010 [compost metagenome]